jgi:hypothetical protein
MSNPIDSTEEILDWEEDVMPELLERGCVSIRTVSDEHGPIEDIFSITARGLLALRVCP